MSPGVKRSNVGKYTFNGGEEQQTVNWLTQKKAQIKTPDRDTPLYPLTIWVRDTRSCVCHKIPSSWCNTVTVLRVQFSRSHQVHEPVRLS